MSYFMSILGFCLDMGKNSCDFVSSVLTCCSGGSGY